MEENRRRFLKATAAFTALSRRRVLGANNRIRVAGIGCGGRARYLLGLISRIGGAETVAVCDVYGPRRREARKKVAPSAREYVDYRQLLERSDVDAVVIGSPDHWHVPMTIDAIEAGKDIYVEKPVSHTIEEGERLRKAADASRQVVQIGYQQRSWEHFKQARRIVASGKLGKITLVLASWYQNYLIKFDPATARVDQGELDWKRWLGSAPDQPVNAVRYHCWRWFWDFGGGHLTDLYSHWGDTIHWFMGEDTPLAAQAMGGRYVLDYLECPDTINAAYDYPGGFAIVYNGTIVSNLEGGNLIFRGSKAMMKANRDGFAVYPEEVVRPKTHYPEPEIAVRSLQDGTIDHMRNFLDCVRTRKTPNAPVGAGVAAARAAHIGNLAYRKSIRVNWNA